MLIEELGKGIMATNEPRRVACGAPDLSISRRAGGLDQTIGYVETKDIGTDLKRAARDEQIKDRYLPSLRNLILTDYVEFWWYSDGELRLKAKLAQERQAGDFVLTDEGVAQTEDLLGWFLHQEPERVTTARTLAVRMAGLARLLRGATNAIFEEEQETGALHAQFAAFREVLLHDLTEAQFADMYAQTISYGLFTARCHIHEMTLYGKDKHAPFHGFDAKAGELTREHAAYMLPKTNPFLRKAFAHIAGPELDDRIAWIVDDIVALLRQADMSEVLRDFARAKGRGDPVVHFYETFLSQYDPKLRKTRGVYYTPDEVVSYIVRSVDWLLQERFGLRRGLADESKMAVAGKEIHQLLILDPAVGTGTFLFEVIDRIHQRFHRQKGMWSGYVREHLLPRLFGFELQMTPYAVCHMKLGLQLADTGYDFASEERLGVYLTNTLEEAAKVSKSLFVQWLSEEARAANDVKKDLPIMVVLGNPPYSGISANQGEWINNLLAPYREVDGQPLGEKKVWVKNDYVKFVRFGQWRIEQTGQGVLAFITDHSYLDSPTFRGMRRNLMTTFDEIYILNLHGNQKRKESAPSGAKDENVFDITQGTAISIFVRSHVQRACDIRYADVWGSRASKYAFLSEAGLDRVKWTPLHPRAPFYEFVPLDEAQKAAYERGWKITEAMPVGSNGVQTSRDALVVALSAEELRKRFAMVRDKKIDDATLRDLLSVEDRSFWRFADAREIIQGDDRWKDCIRRYIYRPFDNRWLFASKAFVHRLRHDVMRHFIKPNVGLCVGRAGLVKVGEWDLVFTVSAICDHNLFYRGSSFNMPLYLYPDGDGQAHMDYSKWPKGLHDRVPNLSPEFVNALAKATHLTFITDGRGDLRSTFGPEDILGYIYAVLYSPKYRLLYGEFLKVDFPRVPCPNDKKAFCTLVTAGQQLIDLHLMNSATLADDARWPAFAEEGNNTVESGYPKYVGDARVPGKGVVFINKDQCFRGVRPDVWEFHVGGYQVCERWLKDRGGVQLSYDEVSHYQKTILAVEETIRSMNGLQSRDLFR